MENQAPLLQQLRNSPHPQIRRCANRPLGDRTNSTPENNSNEFEHLTEVMRIEEAVKESAAWPGLNPPWTDNDDRLLRWTERNRVSALFDATPGGPLQCAVNAEMVAQMGLMTQAVSQGLVDLRNLTNDITQGLADLRQEMRRGFQLVNAKQNLATCEFSLYVAESNLASCSARFAMQSGCLHRNKCSLHAFDRTGVRGPSDPYLEAVMRLQDGRSAPSGMLHIQQLSQLNNMGEEDLQTWKVFYGLHHARTSSPIVQIKTRLCEVSNVEVQEWRAQLIELERAVEQLRGSVDRLRLEGARLSEAAEQLIVD